MKNVKENQLVKCILKEREEFNKDILEAFGNNAESDYSWGSDTVYIVDSNGDVDRDKALTILSAYYDVEVIEYHLTGVETQYIWISYK